MEICPKLPAIRYPSCVKLPNGMITSTIQVMILVPVFFFLMKRRALRAGTLSIKTKTE